MLHARPMNTLHSPTLLLVCEVTRAESWVGMNIAERGLGDVHARLGDVVPGCVLVRDLFASSAEHYPEDFTVGIAADVAEVLRAPNEEGRVHP